MDSSLRWNDSVGVSLPNIRASPLTVIPGLTWNPEDQVVYLALDSSLRWNDGLDRFH